MMDEAGESLSYSGLGNSLEWEEEATCIASIFRTIKSGSRILMLNALAVGVSGNHFPFMAVDALVMWMLLPV